MFQFWADLNPEVYSDFILLVNNNIYGISLIGPDIAIKSYRAKFMDSTLVNNELWFECENTNSSGKHVRLKKPSNITYQCLPQEKTKQGLQVVMLSEDVIWGANRNDLLTRLHQMMYGLNIPTPAPDEICFEMCMEDLLEDAVFTGYLEQCSVLGNTVHSIEAYLRHSLYEQDFKEAAENTIAKYVDGELTTDDLMEGIEGVADYIEKFATEISNKIGDKVEYLHTPGDYDEAFFEGLTRKLFPQQKDISVAASKRLDRNGNVIISGEMGTGKTTIGTVTCHFNSRGKPYRTFVSCPGHLVEKWSREIKAIIPDAKTFIFLKKDKKPWQDFYNLWRCSDKPKSPQFWIVSNEALRSGYILRPGVQYRKKRVYDAELQRYRTMKIAMCPTCGQPLFYTIKDDKGSPIKMHMTEWDFQEHNTGNHKCQNIVRDIHTADGEVKERICGAMLWQADNNRTGYRKVSIVDIVKRQIPKGFFTYYIADEAHKYKGSTAQGLAYGGISSRTKKTIPMTGTLADGYASGLYYIIWRIDPKAFMAKGYYHDEESRTKFQNNYGFWIKTMKIKEEGAYGKSSRAKNGKVTVKPLPGYTINTFPEWLLERTCFLKLSDVAPYLPPLNEFVNAVDMDPELAKNYRDIEAWFKEHMKEGGNKLASLMLHTLLSYPDLTEGPDTIDIETFETHLHYELPQLDKTKLYNKEVMLQDVIKSELKQGRKCLVCSTYSNTRDGLKRIEWIANQIPGASTKILRSDTVSTAKREEWVKTQLNKLGTNILICHPELVETGLDLLELPTIIWAQTGHKVPVVRQTSRRSWRIGQNKEVRVIFICYKNTWQEKCFQLIGNKMKAAGILEGNLTNEGLRDFGNTGDTFGDILTLLKNSMVTVKNSNDIFAQYRTEVAELLEKPDLTEEEQDRLFTLSEIIEKGDIDLSYLTKRQIKKLMTTAENQLVLF